MTATIIGPRDGEAGALGALGVRFMVNTADSGGGFSLVEHVMPPRALAAPLHRHANEAEYSYVLEGRMGALLGDDHVEAGPGELVFKPRNQWHSFWNAGDEPCRLLELISPGGFEQYFAEALELGPLPDVDPQRLSELAARYGLEIRPESIPELIGRFGLRM